MATISSSETFAKRRAIFLSVRTQWISKDIPSYGSQSKLAKIAMHWFGKYYKYVQLMMSYRQRRMSVVSV